MNKKFAVGTNRSISFGDHFLGLWTLLEDFKNYKIENFKLILILKNNKLSFIKNWFSCIDQVMVVDKNNIIVNNIDIHLHSKQFANQSTECPYGYFINHNLNPNNMEAPEIVGTEIEKVKNASCILFKTMGEWTNLSLDDQDVEYLKEKTNCIVNEEELLNYDLGDVLYTIHKYNVPVISYRNGLCDFFYFISKNSLTIIYPSTRKTTYTWLINSKLCSNSLSLKNRLHVKEISEDDIKNEF